MKQQVGAFHVLGHQVAIAVAHAHDDAHHTRAFVDGDGALGAQRGDDFVELGPHRSLDLGIGDGRVDDGLHHDLVVAVRGALEKLLIDFLGGELGTHVLFPLKRKILSRAGRSVRSRRFARLRRLSSGLTAEQAREARPGAGDGLLRSGSRAADRVLHTGHRRQGVFTRPDRSQQEVARVLGDAGHPAEPAEVPQPVEGRQARQKADARTEGSSDRRDDQDIHEHARAAAEESGSAEQEEVADQALRARAVAAVRIQSADRKTANRLQALGFFDDLQDLEDSLDAAQLVRPLLLDDDFALAVAEDLDGRGVGRLHRDHLLGTFVDFHGVILQTDDDGKNDGGRRGQGSDRADQALLVNLLDGHFFLQSGGLWILATRREEGTNDRRGRTITQGHDGAHTAKCDDGRGHRRVVDQRRHQTEQAEDEQRGAGPGHEAQDGHGEDRDPVSQELGRRLVLLAHERLGSVSRIKRLAVADRVSVEAAVRKLLERDDRGILTLRVHYKLPECFRPWRFCRSPSKT